MSHQEKDHIISTGIAAVSDLGNILRAISRLAKATGDSVISNLADIGVRSANEAHNTLETAADSSK
ncbi:hypothetical protein [Herbaspirillum sp. C7C8]|uniref:hypothetical protein n=1 Tax=Herbaspirillum sp. C7C8 TaxID=2736665 RepID=UPI001F52859C|nr:hypothetical protein [Herbaspirillum sp. C7C8]MCI1005232.1 hypothetical protein [Herbaspirillum sp. C7C8]